MSQGLDFSGKVVIVTGGGKGVGRGITLAFLEAGADVVICGRREPESLPEAKGKAAVFIAADVREYAQVDRVVTETATRFGRLDVLVNNAGGAPFIPAADAKPSLHEKIIALNLTSALHFCQRANAQMQAQEEGGVIVNIASVSGTRPSPGTAAYGAAKAGLLNLTRSLAVEWAPKVRLNCVTAGMIRTEQAHLHYGGEEGIARVSATVPLGRMGLPEDVANCCLFLASPLASYISGASLVMDGGGERPAFLDAATANK
jgi:NAD(P)-dependent dehydrogenase (short-subunit alcohol dehydrogenase family)